MNWYSVIRRVSYFEDGCDRGPAWKSRRKETIQINKFGGINMKTVIFNCTRRALVVIACIAVMLSEVAFVNAAGSDRKYAK